MKRRWFGIKGLPGRLEVQNRKRQPIDKIHNSGKSIGPVVIGKIGYVEERDQFQLYAYVFSQKHHFAVEYGDRRSDEECHWKNKMLEK